MAPEQFAGNPCAASDTYALGVVAYEILTGNPPFSSASMTHLVSDDQTMTLPRSTRPDLPEAAERALLKALSFAPEKRQASVRELGEQLYVALCDVTEPTRRTFEEPTRRTAGAPTEGGLEMAHVLFTDLVGYSLLPMDKQKQHLGELQAIVKAAPRFRAAEKAGEIISLPTGDGMALVFFGDPTAPAQCALEVAAGLKSKPHLKLRMGIHTGPVYRVADVNANANVAGGGINIAQRVMDCGDAGHILVSKTVADVLLQLSDWSPCLRDLGEQSVKHGVKVHIYNLATAEAGNAERPAKLKAAGVAPPKKSKTGLIAVAAVAVVLAAAGGWFATQNKPPELTYQVQGDAEHISLPSPRPNPAISTFSTTGRRRMEAGATVCCSRETKAARPGPPWRRCRIPEQGSFGPQTAKEKDYPYLVWAAAHPGDGSAQDASGGRRYGRGRGRQSPGGQGIPGAPQAQRAGEGGFAGEAVMVPVFSSVMTRRSVGRSRMRLAIWTALFASAVYGQQQQQKRDLTVKDVEPPKAATRTVAPPRSYALIVGIGKYQNL